LTVGLAAGVEGFDVGFAGASSSDESDSELDSFFVGVLAGVFEAGVVGLDKGLAGASSSSDESDSELESFLAGVLAAGVAGFEAG